MYSIARRYQRKHRQLSAPMSNMPRMHFARWFIIGAEQVNLELERLFFLARQALIHGDKPISNLLVQNVVES
jgi:hypothetical protein